MSAPAGADAEAAERRRRSSTESVSVSRQSSASGSAPPSPALHATRPSVAMDYAAQRSLTVASAASYVPRRVVELYTTAATPPSPPCLGPPLRTLVLFSDVSGYSRLTRWMASRFEEGPWATSQILSKLFGGMAACVQRHGGDILKFAGDALLVAWPLSPEPHAEADAAAAAAALACCGCMLQLDATAPAPGEPPLTLHIALHYGTVAEMHLGDGDAPGGRWEHMVTGDCVSSDLGPLIAAAGPNELVASAAFWALLDAASAPRCEECNAGHRVAREWLVAMPPARMSFATARMSYTSARISVGSRLSSTSEAEETGPAPVVEAPAALPGPLAGAALAAVQRYLPRSLVDTLAGGTQFWLAENRRVAVMFVALPPVGAGDFALAQALVAEVHAVVGRSGGTCQQTITDDKGTVSIGIWGKPPLSHADDACRALAAAQALCTSLRRIAAAAQRDEPIAIGVTAGRAFCGNVGSPLRCEWCVVGDVMNTAARLMAAAAADGRPMYCDSAVARAAVDAAAEEGAPPPAWFRDGAVLMALKGHAGPFSAYAPSAAEEPRRANSNDLPVRSNSAMASMRRAASLDVPRRTSGELAALGKAPGSGGSSGAGASIDEGFATMCVAGAAEASPRDVSMSSGEPNEDAFSNDEYSTTSTSFADRPALLFGRDADLARVSALLGDAGARRGLLLLISGGLSMGKSSFLRTCAFAAREAGLAVCMLAPPGGGLNAETPYHSWRTPWFAAAVAAHLPALPPAQRQLAPLLAELLPGDAETAAMLAAAAGPGGAAAVEALSEPARATARAELVAAVLHPALGAGEGVLLQDDLSEADALSCELLAAVLASLRPAVLVTAGRGELEDPDSAAAAAVAALAVRASSSRTVPLGALDAAAVEALAAHELGAASPAGLPPGLARSLIALTGGHPLFVKELLSLLVRQGHLALEDGAVAARCDVTRLDELVALGPADGDGMARLEVLVQRRVDSMGPAARSALKAAAVLGRDFDLPLLARAYAGHVTLATARSLAAELVDEGMWVHVHAPRGESGGGAKYRFAHDVVRALVYASTPADQRVELHARVLRCLEEAQEQGAEDEGARHHRPSAAVPAMQWAERARHARGANQHAKATSYFLASARASATGVAAARRVADAARFAQEGLASLRAAAEQDTSAAPAPGREDGAPTAGAGAGRTSGTSNTPLDSLRAELMAVLDTVRRVQTSWALIEPAMGTHGVALMRDFFIRAPDSLPMFSFGTLSPDDPAAEPKMRKHAITLMSTVGSCVAGLRDFEAMIPTLVSVGKMHHKFGPKIRLYFPPMGESLIATLRLALGDDFTPDVEAAWQAMYDVISLHIFDGIERAAAAEAEESSLRGQLLGGLR